MSLMRVTMLGCGSSPGTPRINGDWGACDPKNPKNRRSRTSILVERIAPRGGKTSVVIDTGPDFREQMLAAGVKKLDAAIFTHGHADHIHGVDDLRGYVLAQHRLMDVYADEQTMHRLKSGFGYCFETPPGSTYPPILIAHDILHYRSFSIEGEGGALTFEPLPQQHGDMVSLGFRIGGLAYCPDVSGFGEATERRLAGLEILIIDALQYKPHPSHFSLSEALEWIDRLKPKRAVLTHMHTPLDYETVSRETPDNVTPGYDGLIMEFSL